MKKYFSLEDSLEILNQNQPIKYRLNDIQDMTLRGLITPCFYYSGLIAVTSFKETQAGVRLLLKEFFVFSGYLGLNSTHMADIGGLIKCPFLIKETINFSSMTNPLKANSGSIMPENGKGDFNFIVPVKGELLDIVDTCKANQYVTYRAALFGLEVKAEKLLISAQELSQILESQKRNVTSQAELITHNKVRNGKSKEKQNAMTTARNIAESLWRMEQHKDTRITDMAYEVYAALHGLGFADQLPEKQESVTDWIRTVAPEHAKRAGRPPKTITPNLR